MPRHDASTGMTATSRRVEFRCLRPMTWGRFGGSGDIRQPPKIYCWPSLRWLSVNFFHTVRAFPRSPLCLSPRVPRQGRQQRSRGALACATAFAAGRHERQRLSHDDCQGAEPAGGPRSARWRRAAYQCSGQMLRYHYCLAGRAPAPRDDTTARSLRPLAALPLALTTYAMTKARSAPDARLLMAVSRPAQPRGSLSA